MLWLILLLRTTPRWEAGEEEDEEEEEEEDGNGGRLEGGEGFLHITPSRVTEGERKEEICEHRGKYNLISYLVGT
jgi:hypothetical protein